MRDARLSFLLSLACVLACQPAAELVEPEPERQHVDPVAPARPQIDGDAIFVGIEWLASDERQGRYTLDPEIDRVAEWIESQYEDLGLVPAPGTESLRVSYELRTKVELGEGQQLAIERRGELVPLGADTFTPRAEGVSGTAKAEVVFVGYGLSWTRGTGETGGIDSYDDLAGVELEGKIALVLAHAPNTPDLMALFGAMQQIAERFEAKAAPLRDKQALAKLEKAHLHARQQIVDLVSPFMDTEDLGDRFWEVQDPKAALDVMALAGVLAARVSQRPQFGEMGLADKVQRLTAAGAAGVIVVQGPRSFVGKQARNEAALPGVFEDGPSGHRAVVPDSQPIPVVQMTWKAADKSFSIEGKKLSKLQAAIDGDYQPRSAALGIQAEIVTQLVEERVEVPNVLATIPGSGDEIIVLGAHFDHIGNDEVGSCRAIVRRDDRDAICNGADDNASGTAMLLEIARAYHEDGITPERSIVFAHFSGEELGLLGSKAMVERSGVDQTKVVAMVNLDMVGRLGPSGLAIGGIGSSEEWMPLLDELGNHDMKILYEGATTTRSDHAWWFRRKIPVLFFFTGIHGDYHRAGDEIEDIDQPGLATIGQLVSDLVFELAHGYALSWSEPPADMAIGRGLPGSDPATVIKQVDRDGAEIER